ncbi:MAG: rhamnosyltransferase [Burkholderiales bacterium 68-12]|nr:MAG: rhamnosyltransferase [Burkholderiales bacterium 68-12]
MNASVSHVYAVVVSYGSDPEQLAAQFERLLPQVVTIVWVDNASPVSLRQLQARWPAHRLHAIWLEGNLGIGAAQNRGIAWALEHGASHVLLMDDDSLPAPDMVQCLLEALEAHPQAAAAGPRHFDPRRGLARTPFRRLQRGRLRTLECSDAQQVWEVDDLIASGCLIPASVLRTVGLMREDLFIDWVDIEWCLRARALGYRVLGSCAALLEHTLGDRVIRVWGKEISLHAPWRHYYQARNLVLVLRSSPMGRGAKIHMALRQLKRFLVFSTLVPGRWAYFRMWVKGCVHGWQGRTGPLVLPARD